SGIEGDAIGTGGVAVPPLPGGLYVGQDQAGDGLVAQLRHRVTGRHRQPQRLADGGQAVKALALAPAARAGPGLRHQRRPAALPRPPAAPGGPAGSGGPTPGRPEAAARPGPPTPPPSGGGAAPSPGPAPPAPPAAPLSAPRPGNGPGRPPEPP